jgi:ferric-dicitrate binding protein FerR (iron transport regulator)
MILLFSSDDHVRQLQRAARATKGVTPSPEEQRREAIDDARELREHARWRQFAFLLFVAPIIVSVATGIAFWIVIDVVISRALPKVPLF